MASTVISPNDWIAKIPDNVTKLNTKTLEQKLNAYLSDRTSFVSEKIPDAKLKALDYISFMDIIIELDNRRYKFTIYQFNKFVICATFRKRCSWLINRGYYTDTGCSPTNKYKQVINIFFNQFDLTKEQFDMMCRCYELPKSTTNTTLLTYKRRKQRRRLNRHAIILYRADWTWVACILKKGYKLTRSNISFLLKCGCNTLIKNYDMSTVTPQILECFCNYAKHLSNDVDITGIKIVPTEKALINLLKSATKFRMLASYVHNIINIILFMLKKGTPFTPKVNEYLQKFYKSRHFYVHQKPILEYLLDIGHIPIFDSYDPYLSTVNALYIDHILTAHYSGKCKMTIEGINLLLKNNIKYQIYNLHVLGLIKSKDPKYNNFISGYYFNLYRFIKHIKLIPNKDTLKYVAKHGDYEAVIDIIDNYGIAPDSEILSHAIRSGDLKLIDHIMSFRIPYNREVKEAIINTIKYSDSGENLFEFFVKHQLKVNYEFIDILIQMRTHNSISAYLGRFSFIEDLTFYNLEYSDELYYVMHKNNTFPKIWASKLTIDEDILTLRKMCRKKKLLKDILTFMKDKNVDFDMYCVENAYISDNPELIDYFNKNYTFNHTLRCLNNVKPRGRVYDELCERLGINSDSMAKQLKPIKN